MSDAMVHRGADANEPWVSAPDARGWDAAGPRSPSSTSRPAVPSQ